MTPEYYLEMADDYERKALGNVAVGEAGTTFALLAVANAVMSLDARLEEYLKVMKPDTRPEKITRLPSPNAEDEAVAKGRGV